MNRNYLYNDNIGQIPKNKQGEITPVILFTNSLDNDKFGELYLFNNFGISGANTITMSSEITTHYVENNSSIQDHWALPPISYTLNGYIGEVVYRPAKKVAGWLEENVTKWTAPLKAISPLTSNYVTTAINVAQHIEETYAKYSRYAERLMRTIGNWQDKTVTNNSNQQEIYQNLKTIRNSRQLVTLYTPYETLDNMAITSVVMTQEENSNYKSSIAVTLQEYREVGTLTRKASEKEAKDFVKSQIQEAENQGEAKTQPADKSVLRTIVDKIFGRK